MYRPTISLKRSEFKICQQFRETYLVSALLENLPELSKELSVFCQQLITITARSLEAFFSQTEISEGFPSLSLMLTEKKRILRFFFGPIALHPSLKPFFHVHLSHKKTRQILENVFYRSLLQGFSSQSSAQIIKTHTQYQRKFIPGQGLQDLPVHMYPIQLNLNQVGYQRQMTLAQGSYSQLSLFHNPKTQEMIVLKQFKPGTALSIMQTEIHHHTLAQGKGESAHILKLLGFAFGDSLWNEVGEFFLILEYAAFGNLFNFKQKLDLLLGLRSLSRDLHQRVLLFLLRRSLRGLLYLQEEQQMAHLDFKPENILIMQDGNVKLADYGSALPLKELSQLTAPVEIPTTAPYNAPESTTSEWGPLGAAYDLWSVGMTLFILLQEKPPLVKRPLNPTSNPVEFEQIRDLSPSLQDLITNLLNPHSEQRPLLRSVLHDKVFANPQIADKNLKNLYLIILKSNPKSVPDRQKIKALATELTEINA